MICELHRGDALSVLDRMPAEFVDACVTSPPYWGLRSYAGARGQFGQEDTFQEYIDGLVTFGQAIWRVLKPGRVWWLNLGDCYTASRCYRRDRVAVGNVRHRAATQLKQKELVGIPWRVAFALQESGWWLRSAVIWHKGNPMPESVKDRPTVAHEFVFLLTNAEDYYFDSDAIRTPYVPSSLPQMRQPYESEGRKSFAANGVQNGSAIKARIVAKHRAAEQLAEYGGKHAGSGAQSDARRILLNAKKARDAGGAHDNPFHGLGANARTVWTINTEPSPLDHFAVMPSGLARRCVLSACQPGGIVLDPFAGTGTTGVVALEEGRGFIGVELSPKYHAIARTRLADALASSTKREGA